MDLLGQLGVIERLEVEFGFRCLGHETPAPSLLNGC
jgi:hypothetical protein